MVLHPMALEVIKRTLKPQFSGAKQDLPKFKRDWHTYVKVMQGCFTTLISDFVIIHSFLDCLEGGPAGFLTQMVSENPQITMGDLWHHLEHRYGGDTQCTGKSQVESD